MSTTRPANTLCREEIRDAMQITLYAPVPVHPRTDEESYLRLCRWIQDEEQEHIDEQAPEDSLAIQQLKSPHEALVISEKFDTTEGCQ